MMLLGLLNEYKNISQGQLTFEGSMNLGLLTSDTTVKQLRSIK